MVDSEIAKKIGEQGWWQGSIATDGALRLAGIEVPNGYSHWVLASQTCNVRSPDFEKVSKIEWVGAKKIDGQNGNYVDGKNPRLFHCEAKSSESSDLPAEGVQLELDIQARIWTDRRLLANIEPENVALLDTGSTLSEKTKDNFKAWLARSYTRLELPDEFDRGMAKSKIKDVLRKGLGRYRDDIYGIFLSIANENEDTGPEPLTARELAELAPPYLLEITVVTHGDSRSGEIRDCLVRQLTEDVVSFKGEEMTREQMAQGCQIRFNAEAIRVVSDERWTVKDVQLWIRYNFVDHFSDSTQIDDS